MKQGKAFSATKHTKSHEIARKHSGLHARPLALDGDRGYIRQLSCSFVVFVAKEVLT